jgi:hypothetical protein
MQGLARQIPNSPTFMQTVASGADLDAPAVSIPHRETLRAASNDGFCAALVLGRHEHCTAARRAPRSNPCGGMKPDSD